MASKPWTEDVYYVVITKDRRYSWLCVDGTPRLFVTKHEAQLEAYPLGLPVQVCAVRLVPVKARQKKARK